MNIEAFDWNVVVIGFWNRAILTPAGIGSRLFGLAEGTPVLVEIPLDVMSVPRVKHEGLIVSVEPQRLVIGIETVTYSSLDSARSIAIKCMEALPETPLTAAGYNIRFKINEPDEELFTLTKSKIDDYLSDAAFEIMSTELSRTISWNKGSINLSVKQKEDIIVMLNFDRQSAKKADLIEWLNSPISDIEANVKKMFNEVIKVSLEG